MTKRIEIYKCNVCGNIVEVVHAAAGKLACCGENMEHMTENTVDAAKEKHVPAIEVTSDAIRVTVGSVEHPMEDKHYIEWIELVAGDKAYRQFLAPGQKPVAEFPLVEGSFSVREYCNLHGLWTATS